MTTSAPPSKPSGSEPEQPTRSGFRRWAPVGLLAALACASAAQFALPLMSDTTTEPAPMPSVTATATSTPETPEVVFENSRGTEDHTEDFSAAPRGNVWDDLVISVRQEIIGAGTMHVTTKLADVLPEDPSIPSDAEDRAALGASVGICEATEAVFAEQAEEGLPVGVYDRAGVLLASNQTEDGEQGTCAPVPVEEPAIGNQFEDVVDESPSSPAVEMSPVG